MIQRKDLLTYQFYKKERFTGSHSGMRYLIRREGEGDLEEFAVYVWPGPYGFDAAADEEKVRRAFPFAEASLEEIAEYLNQAYEKRDWRP